MSDVAHAVDQEGRYVGLVQFAEGMSIVTGPPPDDNWRWIDARWQRHVPLAAFIESAIDQIDRMAGAVRLRFITDVPGQQGTYMRKAQDAKQYVEAGYEGPLPPYIDAEAQATGKSARECADKILALSSLWEEQVGPLIERLRIAGKIAVSGVTSVEQGVATLESVIASLDSIKP